MHLADWLDGLEKTVASSKSVKHATETASSSDEEVTLLVPESLVMVCRMLRENVAANFQQLFNYVSDTG